MTDPPPEPDEMQVFYSAGTRRRRRPAFLAGGALVVLALVATVLFLTRGSNAKPANPLAHHTKPAVSPYALNDDPPPSLAGAYSDNLKTAFLALSAYGDWLLSHPNAKFVANDAEPGSPAYETLLYNVDYLLARRAHVAKDPRGYGGDIQYVKVTVAPQPILDIHGRPEELDGHPAFGSGVVTAVSHYLASNIYTARGKYLQPSESTSGYLVAAVSMTQGRDGQWLLYQIQVLHPSGGPESVEQ